jgi:AraC-like DNA-binding protein
MCRRTRPARRRRPARASSAQTEDLAQHRLRAPLHARIVIASAPVKDVTSIAAALGYESPSAFVYMFRKTLGITPGRYYAMAR